MTLGNKCASYQLIASSILERILKGEWKKGTKIPSVDELESLYPFSRATIHKGVKKLLDDGYLAVRRGVGTYVSTDRIQRCVGIVTSLNQTHPQTQPFACLVTSKAEAVLMERGVTTRKYFLEVPPTLSQALLEDIRKGRLQGLLSVQRWHVADWGIKESGVGVLPAVHIGVPIEKEFVNHLPSHCVGIDFVSAMEQAVVEVVKRGRKRVAALGMFEQGPASLEQKQDLARIMSRHGLSVNERRFVSTPSPEFERRGFQESIQLLREKDRPDALIVLNDVVAKGAVQAALKLGVRVPRDLMLVVLTQKDSGIFYPVPIVALEVDTNRIAVDAVDSLVRLMNEQHAVPEETMVAPKKRNVWISEDGKTKSG